MGFYEIIRILFLNFKLKRIRSEFFTETVRNLSLYIFVSQAKFCIFGLDAVNDCEPKIALKN